MDIATISLAEYLTNVLAERNLSVRGLAHNTGMTHDTMRRILAGEQVSYKTLNKIAAYLNLPTENVYRMAGILPEQTEKEELIGLIVHLFAKLPMADQAEILDIIRLKLDRHLKEQAVTQPPDLREVER